MNNATIVLREFLGKKSIQNLPLLPTASFIGNASRDPRGQKVRLFPPATPVSHVVLTSSKTVCPIRFIA